VWIHSSYDGETFDYDFAIIKVRAPFFDREIAVVTRDDNQLIDVGSMATITGWGVDATGNRREGRDYSDVRIVSENNRIADIVDVSKGPQAAIGSLCCNVAQLNGAEACGAAQRVAWQPSRPSITEKISRA
jgi:trypsin